MTSCSNFLSPHRYSYWLPTIHQSFTAALDRCAEFHKLSVIHSSARSSRLHSPPPTLTRRSMNNILPGHDIHRAGLNHHSSTGIVDLIPIPSPSSKRHKDFLQATPTSGHSRDTRHAWRSGPLFCVQILVLLPLREDYGPICCCHLVASGIPQD